MFYVRQDIRSLLAHEIKVLRTFVYFFLWLNFSNFPFASCSHCTGSHERHRHKINTKTRHYFSFGTCEDKTTRIFLCFAFCSALGLCLDYDLMLMTILMSEAWHYSFVLPFVFALMLMLSCEPGLKLGHAATVVNKQLLSFKKYFTDDWLRGMTCLMHSVMIVNSKTVSKRILTVSVKWVTLSLLENPLSGSAWRCW